jgi:hypothetical protein
MAANKNMKRAAAAAALGLSDIITEIVHAADLADLPAPM